MRLWPRITDIESAQNAVREAFWAVILIICVTTGFAILGGLGISILGYDLWALVDAGLFAVIAFGIWRLSRVAAVAGLVLFLLGQIYIWYVRGRTAIGALVASALALVLVGGVRGAFAYHKLCPPLADGGAMGLLRRRPQTVRGQRVERGFRRATWVVALATFGLSALGWVVSLFGWQAGETPLEDVSTFAVLAAVSLVVPWALFFAGRWIAVTLANPPQRRVLPSGGP